MQLPELPSDIDAMLGRLQERGIVGDDATAQVLPGGVSNDVLIIQSSTGSCVVKHPLHRLRVAAPWYADTSRIVREGIALQSFEELTPGRVPPVIDLDVEHELLTLAYAPAHWFDWREALLNGRAAEPWIATELGGVLGTWHARTAGGRNVPQELTDQHGFHQLRLEPFHEAITAHHPDLRSVIDDLIDQLRSPICLVHGDFSPKNVLVGDHELWVLDAEVAHVGDPVFDVAFLHTHLLLKSVARPMLAPALRACAASFDAGYEAAAPNVAGALGSRLARHIGALLLARVDGRSPAAYLDDEERAHVRSLGRSAVIDGADPWETIPPADVAGS